jgi:hypothetical protein
MDSSLQQSKGVVLARADSIDPRVAVDEVHAAFEGLELAGVLYFASSRCDFAQLSEMLHKRLGVPSVGCTTAGEVSGYAGHGEHSVVAIGFLGEHFQLDSMVFQGIRDCTPERIADEFERAPIRVPSPSFCLMLIDGLSMAEERVSAGLARALRDVPLIGGSAGDDLDFRETLIARDGRTMSDSAALICIKTDLPWSIFHSHHFTATDERLVITGADPARRCVTEINGEPAAEGYARAVGLEVDELSPMVFAEHPVVLSIGGEYYVRSIQQANPDGSLTFFCAIDEGLVLRIACGHDLPGRFARVINEQRERVGELGALIGFDCILRRIELLNRDQRDEVGEILAGVPFIGFSTYGEQINGLHVNQTMTGVAIGRAA